MIISSINISCKSDETTGYKEFVVNEGLAQFSFEYPAFFSDPYLDRSQEPQSTVVKTGDTAIEPGKGVESLYVFVFSPSDSFADAKARLESEHDSISGFPDFKLLDRSTTTVTGIQVELISYSYGLFWVDVHKEAGIGTAYEAYFDYQGFIWQIELIVDEYAVEQAKVHFDHVLETFEIFD